MIDTMYVFYFIRMDPELMTVTDEGEPTWQADISDVKAEGVTPDVPKDDIITAEGATGYSSLMADSSTPGQPATSPQLLEACAEVVVQQSLGGNFSSNLFFFFFDCYF